MSVETKDFDTLAVGSAATGIALKSGMNYGTIQEIVSWVIGYDIFTHELVHDSVKWAFKHELVGLFPALFVDYEGANFEQIGQCLLKAYGAVIAVPKGRNRRTAGPITTFKEVLEK
ncbi:MAG: hypothetical protein AAGH90_10520 [Pseudomonadota bacterium]